MKKLLLLSLVTLQVHAGVAFWCPANPTVIQFPRPAGECYQVDDSSFNAETASNVGGALSVDATKLAAYQARLAARQTALAARDAKVATCQGLYANVDALSTLPEAKALLKCLVRDER
jgi:hypothetical protein